MAKDIFVKGFVREVVTALVEKDIEFYKFKDGLGERGIVVEFESSAFQVLGKLTEFDEEAFVDTSELAESEEVKEEAIERLVGIILDKKAL